tara:strand:+ start:198 stop:395 length:198 start_codon:yes stop_codon:yes gene_type:complete
MQQLIKKGINFMFNKLFIDALITFLYANLKNTPITKHRIALLFTIFNDGWKKELKEIKYNEKKLS